MLLEALASGESALKIGSAIALARSVFRERELHENAELQVRTLEPLALTPRKPDHAVRVADVWPSTLTNWGVARWQY